ncbi:hypothetical protein BAY1663_04682 [Pseudomonas sp. BAY1663]|uniref:Lipoprotein n=1 Tax=Stutzerimonas stutzeri TaxID=316 RepID=A0A2N8SRV9_STUST|nr:MULTISPECIES: hypothetical protein [Pseudomonadaceae]EXF42912.1 hypothetical protein BAY1663_04682 [Pseudomonas sp. BAY1663]MCQ4326862.1 hypothetical protein [Stutzerimonas stutzeri]PNG05212.1 hypothetical protein CXK94_20505 [Stutzerimonas stutzeri]
MKGIAALASSLLLAACASSAPIDRTLAGHYLLQGAMEMGSELLLNEDGSFEAAMSYGILDVYTRGRWSQSGDRLTLHRERPRHNVFAPDMDLGQLIDGMELQIRPDCLVVEALDACYAKAPTGPAAH